MNLFQKMAAFFTRPLTLTSPDGWVAPDCLDAGVSVNDQSALGLTAVWACLNLLAGTIASLPLVVYRDRNGSREIAKDHPLYYLLHDSPNADQTALDFWEMCVLAQELRGNSYSRIVRNGNRVVALVPVHPDLVQVKRDSRGDLEYTWTEDGRSFTAKQDEMLHVRGFGGGPMGGLSTLAYGRQTFGLALAINQSASKVFSNGLRPSGILTFSEFLKPEHRTILETNLVQKFTGAMNTGRPMILEGGSKWEQLTINPEDAQMLESRAFSVEEVCRFFGVPPFMVGHTEKTTSWGTGLEQQVLAFQKFTLRRRLKRIEMALEKQLLSPKDRADGVTIEFVLEGLLRADSKSRAEFYQKMTSIGAMTINEVRGLENLPPIDGGNVPRVQMQNQPISATDANAAAIDQQVTP